MDYFVYIVAAVTIVLSFALPISAKYCTFDVDGEYKYYICPRNEYCCKFGCCLSPTFQFYQLWYYWLMVIFMFLLCSGGGWWYRYWLQGRYGPELGTPMPLPSSRLHSHHLTHRPARVSYHPSRDAVVLHHIWKPRGLGSAFPHASPPPSYATAQRASSVSLPNDASHTSSSLSDSLGAAGLKMSPYYQLYGPPPPYEAVVNSQPEMQQTSDIADSQMIDSTMQQHTSPQTSDDTATTTTTTCTSCSESTAVATEAVTVSLPASSDLVTNRNQHSSSSSPEENCRTNQNVV